MWDLFIEIPIDRHSSDLVNCKKIRDVPIVITSHNPLHSDKDVIAAYDLRGIPGKELMEGFVLQRSNNSEINLWL